MGGLVSPKSSCCLLSLVLIIGGIIGLTIAICSITPIVVYKITGIIPTKQYQIFEQRDELIPILVEVPREVRPGSNFNLIIRGSNYLKLNDTTQVTFSVSTQDIEFIQKISPSSIQIETEQSDNWMLEPQIITITTVNPLTPPSRFNLEIEEIVLRNPEQLHSDVEIISVDVDRLPIPIWQIVGGLISLIAFLVGVFGAVLVQKIL